MDFDAMKKAAAEEAEAAELAKAELALKEAERAADAERRQSYSTPAAAPAAAPAPAEA